MSTSIFPPPADECSCLVDGCNWLDHGCCETKDLKDGEGAQAEVLVQCPRLLAHYREQHGVTTAAAWRPSIFTFKVPKHHSGSPCLGPWSPCLSPSLHTPGLAWWLQGVITGTEIILTVKVADLGLTGLKPYWLIKPQKTFDTKTDTEKKVLEGNPGEDLGYAKILKRCESSWMDVTKANDEMMCAWIDMKASFSFKLDELDLEGDELNLEGIQLWLRLVLGQQVWDKLGRDPYSRSRRMKQTETVRVTPGVKEDEYNIDEVLACLGETQNRKPVKKMKGEKNVCEAVTSVKKAQVKKNVNDETDWARLEELNELKTRNDVLVEENHQLHEDKRNILTKLEVMALEKLDLKDILQQEKEKTKILQIKGEALIELFDREQRYSSALEKKIKELEKQQKNLEVCSTAKTEGGSVTLLQQEQQGEARREEEL